MDSFTAPPKTMVSGSCRICKYLLFPNIAPKKEFESPILTKAGHLRNALADPGRSGSRVEPAPPGVSRLQAPRGSPQAGQSQRRRRRRRRRRRWWRAGRGRPRATGAEGIVGGRGRRGEREAESGGGRGRENGARPAMGERCDERGSPRPAAGAWREGWGRRRERSRAQFCPAREQGPPYSDLARP